MQNKKWDAHQPGENKFTVRLNVTGSGNAVSALLAPMSDVLANLGPEKAQTEAVKHFKCSHVAGGGGGMVSGKDGATKGLGNNNQQKGMRIVTGLLRDNETVIEDRHGIVTQVGAVWCWELLEQLLGPMEVRL